MGEAPAERTRSRLGVVAQGRTLADIVRLAQRIEGLGYDSVWATEFYDSSATITLAAIAAATRRVTVGSAIAYAVGRTPLVLAAEARDLDELSGGRLVLGLGTGTRTMQRDWHGADPDAPAVRMEELVPLLRAFWNMDSRGVHHDGRFYHVALVPTGKTKKPFRPAIPVYLAGVNPRMIRAAGSVADGLVGHPMFTPRYVTEVVRPALAEGASLAGRREAVPIAGYVMCSINEDAEIARRDAKAQIAFYCTVRTYESMLASAGFDGPVHEIRRAWAARDTAAMLDAVTDKMVDAIAVVGTPDEARDRLADQFFNLYEDTLLYAPSFLVPSSRFAENLETIADVFARPGARA